MFLPLPVIILQQDLSVFSRVLCFVLPAIVQGAIGNVLVRCGL